MYKRRKNSILIVILIVVVIYYSPFGEELFGRTIKNYFYDENNKKNVLTAILYTGLIWSNESKVLPNSRLGMTYIDNGMGLYLIPGKFKGRLPEKNYIRFDYRGDDTPIYYRWANDTLWFRIPGWEYRIIENKLFLNVMLDTLRLRYEQYGTPERDTTRNVKERLEWKEMRSRHKSFSKFDLK